MQTPKIPSFFKEQSIKRFSFNPRYYDKRKEKRKELEKGRKTHIRFTSNHTKKKAKGRNMRIVLLIIILSLLAYKFIIN